MDVLVCSRHNISKISPSVPYAVISIVEPNNSYALFNLENNLLKNYIFLRYADEDNYQDAKFYGREKFLFSDEQAQLVVNFVNNTKDEVELIVCQCDGGVSRSSATAAAILVYLHGSKADEQIFKSPQYVPNMYVYRKLLNAFFKM
ncbi:MAG: hypothetical protein ABEK17_00015 [Candidatus Aenigmatarchaeota archaeon]